MNVFEVLGPEIKPCIDCNSTEYGFYFHVKHQVCGQRRYQTSRCKKCSTKKTKSYRATESGKLAEHRAIKSMLVKKGRVPRNGTVFRSLLDTDIPPAKKRERKPRINKPYVRNPRRSDAQRRSSKNGRISARINGHFEARRAVFNQPWKNDKICSMRALGGCHRKLEWHHFNGYKKEAWLDVVCACKKHHNILDKLEKLPPFFWAAIPQNPLWRVTY